MKEAFGVQAEMKADYIPKGTSVVTTEFSPGRPDPTALDSIRQHTIDSSKSTLKFNSPTESDERDEDTANLDRDAARLREELAEEIAAGTVSISREGARVIVHIHEQGSFGSGYADVKPTFLPTLDKIGRLISDMEGIVQVTGHTDDVPIANARFRSNWELSAGRAVSVVHRLLDSSSLDPRRVVVTGLASTQPRVANDSPENRARNRRVEISLVRTIEQTADGGVQGDADAGPQGD
jgi:chemotaxis protein MotB